MASIFDGMFTSPEEVKNKRMQDIMDARTRLSQSGGSMNQLLGQVAGQGLLTGRSIGEAVGSMAGLSTKSEQKAAELQAMMQSVDPTDPDALANIAKMMNELGYTKEAIAILERRNAVLSNQREQEKYKTEKAQGKTRNMYVDTVVPARFDKEGNLLSAARTESRIITQTWDDKRQEWLPPLPANARPAAGTDGKGYKVGWEEFFKPTEETTEAPAEAKPTPSQKDNSGLDYSHWGY